MPQFDLTIPEHSPTGILNGDDLHFFYYDVGLDNLDGSCEIYDWNSIIKEFDGILTIKQCKKSEIPKNYTHNCIYFTRGPKECEAAAFTRHLRNAFAHYHINREGENYCMYDEGNGVTMRGLINAEALKKLCFKLKNSKENVMYLQDASI